MINPFVPAACPVIFTMQCYTITGTVMLCIAAYVASLVLALQDRLVVLRHGATNQELRGDRQEGSQRGSLVGCLTFVYF